MGSITKEVPPYIEDAEIKPLSGLNCPSAVKPGDVMHRIENEPYEVRSPLGWHLDDPVNVKKIMEWNVTRSRFPRAAGKEGAISTHRY